MVFIDADHAHEQSLKDFINVFPRVINDGFIFFHDSYPCLPYMFNKDKSDTCYKTPLYLKTKFIDSLEILTLPFNPGVTIVKKIPRTQQLIYDSLKHKRIFITGGAGYLGRHLIEEYYRDNEITVYSRDEAKHYYLKKVFPKVRFVIGDIRNLDLLSRSIAGHNIGIFAASLKQIDAVNDNYEEATEVIVRGGLNSKRAALDNGLEAACFVSSDKSRAATTIYGAMKFIAGETFIRPINGYQTLLSCAVYGNVTNSTGSVIPLIWDAIRTGYSLTLYSPEMTRFMLTIKEAVALITKSLSLDGYNVIPNLRSFRIQDLFEIYADKFGLKYSVGQPRPSEKIHEIMIAEEEIARVRQDGQYYLMHYNDIFNGCSFPNSRFSSQDVTVSKDVLDAYLHSFQYYKP